MSGAVKQFLLSQGVSSSRTCPYNPRGNSQCERYNGVIWNTISLALEDQGLPIERWEEKLPEALHAIRSLLCTSTNVTPHERFLAFERHSVSGTTLPSWMLERGDVLLRKFGRSSKYDPAVEVVELMEVNPTYAHVKFSNGREDTVALRNLAPLPCKVQDSIAEEDRVTTGKDTELPPEPADPSQPVEEAGRELRRSTRVTKPVDRLAYF